MHVEVFKRTKDDWYPSYSLITDGILVKESLVCIDYYWLKPGDSDLDNDGPIYFVSAWGSDDYGLERAFTSEKEAWTTFLEIIGQDYVSAQYLRDRGFTSS
jgi:hypothetical protein